MEKLATMIETSIKTTRPVELVEIPLARALFTGTSLAWIWLVVRIYLGWQWLGSGLEKIADPAWVGDGSALLGFWKRAVLIPPPPARPPVAYDWYRAFLQTLIDGQSHTWFAKLIAYGELLVGVGLIVGALVGVTAVFGALMNMNYMLAGSASTNPVLFLLAVLLILAWRTAGYLGVDHVVLPVLAARVRRSAAAEAAAGESSPEPLTLSAATRRSEAA
jgi:thiosulfate dehydrogenase [quinone] large subunit